MSASSWWVTCGIITQLRARFGAADLLDPRRAARARPRRTSRSRPSATAARSRPGGRRRRRAAARPARSLARAHVLLGDPALAAGALHAREVDAELAREAAHRRAGVDRRAARPAAPAPGGGAGAAPRARRGGSGAACGARLGGRLRPAAAAPARRRAAPRSAGPAPSTLDRQRSASPRRPCRRRLTASSCDHAAERRRARPSSPCRTRA